MTSSGGSVSQSLSATKSYANVNHFDTHNNLSAPIDETSESSFTFFRSFKFVTKLTVLSLEAGTVRHALVVQW